MAPSSRISSLALVGCVLAVPVAVRAQHRSAATDARSSESHGARGTTPPTTRRDTATTTVPRTPHDATTVPAARTPRAAHTESRARDATSNANTSSAAPGEPTYRSRRNRTADVDSPRTMPALSVRGAPPPLPPCLRSPVEVRRINGHASWTGALTDCEGHPTLHGLAAISALASPTHFDALPDLEPIVREIRRVAPAVGWTVIDEHPRRPPRTACPPGQEMVAQSSSSAPDDVRTGHDDAHSQRTARSRSRDRARTPRTSCRAIDVARDPHTEDAMVILENRVRIVNPRLLTMLDEVTRHFAGHRVEMISGYRPSNDPRAGSRHAHARAIDYRLAGISREALRDFAYTLPLAGVGYYPNSVFIHMDVRDRDEGSARWTDYASHGESARYGHWPPRDSDVSRETEFLVQQAGHALDALRESENGNDEPEAPRETGPSEPDSSTPTASSSSSPAP